MSLFYHTPIFVLVFCISTSSLFAQDDQPNKKSADRKKRAGVQAKREAARTERLTSAKAVKVDAAARKSPLSKAHQAAAMAFARENHPELVPLIQSLKSGRQGDYNRALRELHSAASRFGKLKERLPNDRYERQLKLWKLDSRIKLQLAKWSVTKNTKLAADIRQSLEERNNIRRQQYEQELLRSQERIAKMESALEKVNDFSADAEFERLSRTVKRRKSVSRKQAPEENKPCLLYTSPSPRD